MDQGNLYLWQVSRFCWMASHSASGMGATGDTREEALKTFRSVWNDRASLTVIDGPPPAPKRPGEHAPIAEAIETSEELRRGYAVYRELIRRYHPDTADEKKVPTGQVAADLIRLWSATR
jgi:hypothetical protein